MSVNSPKEQKPPAARTTKAEEDRRVRTLSRLKDAADGKHRDADDAASSSTRPPAGHMDTRQRVLPLASVVPNPDQPRKHFDEKALEELSQSIRDHGVLQPVVVKLRDDGTYILAAGERRYRAALAAGLTEIPVVVTQDDERVIALIENVQRQDLNPVEEAEGYKALMDYATYTQEQLAKVVGKSRQSVGETLQLLGLPDDIRDECRTFGIGTKLQLLQVVREPNTAERGVLWEAIKSGKLTVHAARVARQRATPADGRRKQTSRHLDFVDLAAHVTITIKKPDATEDEILEVLTAAHKEQQKRSGKKGRKWL